MLIHRTLCFIRIWTAGEPENDARTERTGQGGMIVPIALQKNMVTLRDSRPGLKEKYNKFPFEWSTMRDRQVMKYVEVNKSYSMWQCGPLRTYFPVTKALEIQFFIQPLTHDNNYSSCVYRFILFPLTKMNMLPTQSIILLQPAKMNTIKKQPFIFSLSRQTWIIFPYQGFSQRKQRIVQNHQLAPSRFFWNCPARFSIFGNIVTISASRKIILVFANIR